MAAAGFAPEDYDDAPVDVWPENWPAWQLYCELSGQWRYSMAGREALDYTPLFMRMERLGLNDAEWSDMFAAIRTIEEAALEQFRATA